MKNSVYSQVCCPVCNKLSKRVRRGSVQRVILSSKAYKCFGCQIRYLVFYKNKICFVYSAKYHRMGDPALSSQRKRNSIELVIGKNPFSVFKLKYNHKVDAMHAYSSKEKMFFNELVEKNHHL
mgnify:FL=1